MISALHRTVDLPNQAVTVSTARGIVHRQIGRYRETRKNGVQQATNVPENFEIPNPIRDNFKGKNRNARKISEIWCINTDTNIGGK